MANHHRNEGAPVHHHSPLDPLVWPLAVTSPLVWPVAPWAAWLWDHFPTPTAVYMAVSAGFMLFQMFDKMGLLERFKRKTLEGPPDDPR